MKKSIYSGLKKSLPSIIAIIVTLVCVMYINTPSKVLSQTPAPAPSTLPAILSLSLEFTPSSSPPTPSEGYISSDYFDIIVRTEVVGIKLVDKSGQPNVPGEGHLVFYSGTEPDLVPTWPAYQEEGYYISTETSVVWIEALPDYSVYGVQIVNNNNTPLNPPVYAMIRTYKQLSENPDRPMITSFGLTTNPPSSPLPSPDSFTRMDTTLNTEVSGFNIVEKYDSPASPGEGHLIYYEVIDPLITSPEESAFVGGKYSYITNATKFTWLNEIAGYTSYSVQLVNNDDTPLRYPVFAVIKGYIYAGLPVSTPATLIPTRVPPSTSPNNGNGLVVP